MCICSVRIRARDWDIFGKSQQKYKNIYLVECAPFRLPRPAVVPQVRVVSPPKKSKFLNRSHLETGWNIMTGGSYPDTFSESDTGCQGRKKCQTRKSVRVGKGCQTWKFGREGLKSCQTRKFGCQGRKKVSDSENYAKMEKKLNTV